MSQSSLTPPVLSNPDSQSAPDAERQSRPDLAGCEECDTIYQKVSLATAERAYCTCCGAELYQKAKPFSNLLALALTALIVFVLANVFPIVEVDLQGNTSQTTLLGAAWMMFKIDRGFVGMLILITTFIVPLLDLLLLIYILSAVRYFNYRPKYLIFALRTLYLFRTWGMVEVFLIGVLVTLVKLVGMVVVIPGVALWAFAVLSVLLVYIASTKLNSIWDEIDRCVA